MATTRGRTTPGIRTRHSRTCRTKEGGACNCKPTYEAWVFSKRDDKKIRRSFSTQAAARGWRIDAQKQVRDKRLRAPTARTLQQEVDEWLDGARAGRILNKRNQPYKPSVTRGYELALRLRVLPELGQRKLADIDLADLLDLKEQLLGEGYTGSTLRNSFVPLQAIYRRARRNGTVAVNPTVDLDLPVAGRRDRAVTPTQAAELLAALNEPERAIWGVALYAGLRRGEVRALRRRDVDLGAATIRVERGWDAKEGPIAPKSLAGTRTVFLLDVLRPIIEPLVERCDQPDDLLFGLGSTPFEPKNVARKAVGAWKAANAERVAAAEEAGVEPVLLEPITPHEGRHSFSTFLDHAGVSASRADRYMGHSGGSVSERYRYLLPGQIADDRKLVDAYLAGTAAGKVVALAAAQ